MRDHSLRPGRDMRGRFTKGNEESSAGGFARARKLTRRRRKAIARKGWRGLVKKRFGGDERAAKAYLGKLGAWASDQGYAGTVIVKFRHPGTIRSLCSVHVGDFLAEYYQLNLFVGGHRDVDFYE